MCKTRREAERALAALTAILAELGLEPKAAKTRIVHLAEGGDGLDFLGFHHRWVRSRDQRFKHVAFLARWPSRQACNALATGCESSPDATACAGQSSKSLGISTDSYEAGRAISATATRLFSLTRSSATRIDASRC
jgi:hypothetical protein